MIKKLDKTPVKEFSDAFIRLHQKIDELVDAVNDINKYDTSKLDCLMEPKDDIDWKEQCKIWQDAAGFQRMIEDNIRAQNLHQHRLLSDTYDILQKALRKKQKPQDVKDLLFTISDMLEFYLKKD